MRHKRLVRVVAEVVRLFALDLRSTARRLSATRGARRGARGTRGRTRLGAPCGSSNSECRVGSEAEGAEGGRASGADVGCRIPCGTWDGAASAGVRGAAAWDSSAPGRVTEGSDTLAPGGRACAHGSKVPSWPPKASATALSESQL